jgi:hypothetical protein
MTESGKKVDHIDSSVNMNFIALKVMEDMGLDDPKEALRRLREGEYKLTKKKFYWNEEKPNQITFTVKSDGTLGPDWMKRLQKRNCKLTVDARKILLSDQFHATRDLEYDVVILRSWELNWYTQALMDHAIGMELVLPLPEIACLIQDKFSNREILLEMGLRSIHIMHVPFLEREHSPPMILSINDHGQGSEMDLDFYEADTPWGLKDGFVFLAKQPKQS